MLKFHSLTVAGVYAETDDAVRVDLDVPAELHNAYRFAPGQHLNLELQIEGKVYRRSYSLCNSVNAPWPLQIAIKRQPGGVVSNYANDHLKPGMSVRVMTPGGHFTASLDSAGSRNLVAFAAGSGITPVLSIIRSTLEQEPGTEFTLFYGNRDGASAMFRDVLHDLKDLYTRRFRLFHILSRELGEIDLYNGRIDGEKCRDLCLALCAVQEVDEWFVCGPAGMIDEIRACLSQLGVDPQQIHHERFAATPAVSGLKVDSRVQQAADQCAVTVIMDGKERAFGMSGAQNVLEAGLRAGLELPYSCTGGVCSTCRAKLLQGEVDMRLNYALEPWETEAGYVLTCQSYPLSERLVLDYDQT